MESNLEEVTLRTRRYWYRDGLGEISVGGFFVLFGLLLCAEAWVPSRSVARNVLALCLPVLCIGGQFILSRIVRQAKERLTYPRTGYVAYVRPDRIQGIVSMMLAIAFASLVALLFIRGVNLSRGLPVFQAIIAGFVMFSVGVSARLTRFYLEAVLILLCGLLLFALGVEGLPGSGALYALSGLVLLAGGGFTLRNYLQTSPSRPEGDLP